jgi:hypothetical protein
MSTVYIFHDQAGTIPGVPGTFAHCVVEVDEETGQATIKSLPIMPIIESTVEPVAESVPQEAPATETIEEQPQEPVIQEEQQQEV